MDAQRVQVPGSATENDPRGGPSSGVAYVGRDLFDNARSFQKTAPASSSMAATGAQGLFCWLLLLLCWFVCLLVGWLVGYSSFVGFPSWAYLKAPLPVDIGSLSSSTIDYVRCRMSYSGRQHIQQHYKYPYVQQLQRHSNSSSSCSRNPAGGIISSARSQCKYTYTRYY